MGHSTGYYRRMKKLALAGNAKAKKIMAKKDSTSAKINKRKNQVKKRVESNREVAKYTKRNGHKPSSKGLQYDHAVNRMVASAVNQGRKGEGGRKKKSKKS